MKKITQPSKQNSLLLKDVLRVLSTYLYITIYILYLGKLYKTKDQRLLDLFSI